MIRPDSSPRNDASRATAATISAWTSRAFALLMALGLTTAGVACNGANLASPNNAPHASRCLTDLDCMGGYACSKGTNDILGECIPKTTAGGAAPVTTPKPSSAQSTTPAAPASPSPTKDDKVTSKSGAAKSQTPEPLPPPKPPNPDGSSPYSP